MKKSFNVQFNEFVKTIKNNKFIVMALVAGLVAGLAYKSPVEAGNRNNNNTDTSRRRQGIFESTGNLVGNTFRDTGRVAKATVTAPARPFERNKDKDCKDGRCKKNRSRRSKNNNSK